MPRITPRETLPVSRLIIFIIIIFWSLSGLRTSILLNKCLIFYPFIYSQDYVLVPDNAYLVVRYHLGTTPWSARRTRARLISGVIQATGDLIDIFGVL